MYVSKGAKEGRANQVEGRCAWCLQGGEGEEGGEREGRKEGREEGRRKKKKKAKVKKE